jgi:hypothetical protein
MFEEKAATVTGGTRLTAAKTNASTIEMSA